MTNTCSDVSFKNIPQIQHDQHLAFEMESKTTKLITFNFQRKHFIKEPFCAYFVLLFKKERKMFSRGFICKIVVQIIEKFQLIASFFDDQCKTEYENENRTNAIVSSSCTAVRHIP